MQENLLLTRMRDGTWGRPVDGTPSTHILKPEIAAYPNMVENEAFCMRIAKHLGLQVANVETKEVAGRTFIVVGRYDRLVQPDGTVERIHQEDVCQATGARQDDKYQEDGGPSLARIADIVTAVTVRGSLNACCKRSPSTASSVTATRTQRTFGSSTSALECCASPPLYDAMCTLAYNDDRLAMYVDDVHRTNRVTAQRLINEGASRGLPRQRCEEIVTDILDRAPDAIGTARDETIGAPDSIVSAVEGQLMQFRTS